MRSRPLRPFACFLFLTCLFIGSAQAWGAAPSAVNDDPDVRRQELLEHRRDEAASKERWARGLLAAKAAQTANQGLYDVTHYGLDLTVNSSTHNLLGAVTTTATVTGASLATLDLDLKANMTVTAATAGGAAAGWSRSGDVLTVSLDRTYTTDETVVVTVSYSGNPAGEYFGWSTAFGRNMTWTLSEPYGARAWWPCKDLNTDKPDSADIVVTVLDNETAASNGLLVSETTDGTWRTFHWKTNYPIATYLVSLAIYPYQRYSDWYAPLGGGDPMEVQFYVYPEHYASVQPLYALTVPMIGTFAQAYGEYPFVDEKYGHAEFVWGGGMEHQTLTSLGGASEDLISHELGHQWWGDMVTCADFGHIWLNEGFATWSEAYWAEQQYGFATYQDYMAIAGYYGAGTIFVEDPLTESIFDSNLSYNKGSWVVHMLRGVLGDADFFAGLALYRANHLYGSATTEDLQAAMEAVSGRDLAAFFQQWIYGEYYPVYEAGWAAGPGAGEVTVTLDQVQTQGGLFTMPVPLRITTDQGVYDVTVENDQLSQQFVVDAPGTVESVAVDPDRWILRKLVLTVPNASLDQGVLLVNGVDWATYGTEITTAYENKAFWGDTPITFWDCFGDPGGYPSTLPAPLGHGPVPPDVIGDYSTVIWVGNNYNGDLARWDETPIKSYLEAGGNVLLLTRWSQAFLTGGLDAYLGVDFAEVNVTIGSVTALVPELTSIAITGTQSFVDLFLASVGPNTTALYKDALNYPARISGALAVPPGGGTFRADGGRFALVGGRPYRLNAAGLSANVETILSDFLLEPYSPVSAVPGDGELPARVGLGRPFPNPFNPRVAIPLELDRAGAVTLDVYDARGSRVRRLLAGRVDAGARTVVWDGTDDRGRAVASGTYFARLRTGDGPVRTRAMALVR
ncbi:hypothetical protein KDM41_03180 [bacterium]|nr:hypothetical protein [bacterium]